MSSARDNVLVAAGAFVARWRQMHGHESLKTWDAVRSAADDLCAAIDAMNATPHARGSDPDTSRQGPSQLQMTKSRKRVMQALQHRPLTDIELLQAPEIHGKMSPSGARSRRAELVRMGIVQNSGKRRRCTSGRLHIVWELASA